MSTCNCDGTISESVFETLFGDDLIKGVEINALLGGFDPRPIACQEAADTLRATGQDPCNLDNPDDLQIYYKRFIPQVVSVGQSTPVLNALQKQFDIAAGTATEQTPILDSTPKKSSNTVFLVGAIVILAIGFILVFK